MFRTALSSAFIGLMVACTGPKRPAPSGVEDPAIPAKGGAARAASNPATTPIKPRAASEKHESSYVAALRARVGNGATLTLVPHLQAAAEKAVRANGKAGAVVAFVPDTGAVLALFSVPGERGDPLLVAHQPASTFKTFTALAGLEAGALTPSTEKQCTGKYKFADKEFRCAGVHGRETTTDAIVRSCNGFFYDVATEIDHSRIIDMARRFGFGSRTGIELSDDAGHVADAARVRHIKLDRRSPVPLRDAIGHGEIKVTLLQLARAYAAIANGGKLVRLRLTQSQPATNAPLGAIERVKMQPEHLELIRAALIDVVASQDGTVHSFAIEGFPFAAKTGAAEAPLLNGRGEEDDAWCVAYAPPRAPKILVAARVERADVSRDAKLAVKQVLEAWRASTP